MVDDRHDFDTDCSACIRLGEPNLYPVVSYGGLPGQTTTEDIDMFARKGLLPNIGRTAVMATVAAMALSAVGPSAALAGSAPATQAQSASAGTSDATDFSSRRYHRGYRGGAAAAGAFAAVVGTGLAIAASQNR